MVGGLNSVTGEHLNWHTPKRLKVGDEITVRIVNASLVDPETGKYKPKEKMRSKRPRRKMKST